MLVMTITAFEGLWMVFEKPMGDGYVDLIVIFLAIILAKAGFPIIDSAKKGYSTDAEPKSFN